MTSPFATAPTTVTTPISVPKASAKCGETRAALFCCSELVLFASESETLSKVKKFGGGGELYDKVDGGGDKVALYDKVEVGDMS